ncbi:hypothetical protein V8E54_009345, partial [Elaphomyces granulatus]
RLLLSGIFTFIVGSEEQPVQVHCAAIAGQSTALDVLMNGRMKEAQTRSAILPDVQLEDFILFCQFAYRGDYTPPLYREYDDSEYTTDSDEESDDDSEGFVDKLDIKEVKGLMADNKSDLPKHVQLRRDFLAQNFLRGRVRDCLAMECGVTPNRTAEEDYTPVFLGHARLYVFAEKYGVSTLRALALSKLHRTLTYFTIFKERIGDVIALVRYAYSNEHTPDYESDIVDDLRRLVTQYVVCEFQAFSNTELFCSLLEEGGPFVRDWWSLVRMYQL